MRVVLIDAVGSTESDRLARDMTGRLTSEAFFDTVIRVRWSARSDPAEQDDAVARLERSMHHADAVVTLPWTAAEPLGAVDETWVERTRWLCQAAGASGVQTLIFGSSALGYSPGRPAAPANETWPMTGLSEKSTSRVLADADTIVGEFERERPVVRVVRLRPALVFDPAVDAPRSSRRPAGAEGELREAGTEVQVLGPAELIRSYRLALTGSVFGPFNLAPPPVPLESLLNGARRPERRPWRLRPATDRPGLDWLRLATTSPILDTSRAARELRFTAVAPTARAASRDPFAVGSIHGPAPVSDFRARSLYQKAVAYFGDCVREIGDNDWGRPAWSGKNLVGLVGDAARDQHELTMRLRGCTEAEAQAQLPDDPLGVDRVDGWELAVEQARSALDHRAADLPVAPLGQASPLGQLLADSAAGLVARGWCLKRALHRDPGADPELLGFLDERLSTGPSPAGVPNQLLVDRPRPAHATSRRR
jgi:UDP-glucose 4-epimerase